MMKPRATFRLQLSAELGFDAAARLAPYLANLGISHLYASPFLAARPGSTHGYDIVEYDRINEELGGRPAFERMVSTLREHDLGLILDFVPNHMGVGGSENPWWGDVLEWGEASPHAGDFDIDWSPAERSLDGKVLLPFLGDHYGNVLERGELQLRIDESGGFSIAYSNYRFPIALRDYAGLLRQAGEASDEHVIDTLAESFESLGLEGPRDAGPELRQVAAALKKRLALLMRDPPCRQALESAVAAYGGDPEDARSFHQLHDLLEQQFYRLAYWRVATQEINYRRFFDINDLAGLRVEEPELFERIHRLVLRLIAEGKLDGLRIDHVDGLYDPAGYCLRLREEMGHAASATWLLVEKILARHEPLPDWPVDGTTGYEFMNAVHGLFVDAGAEESLTRTYRRFSGETEEFAAVAARAKRDVMLGNLASELNVLAGLLKRIARRSWRSRDFTRTDLRAAFAAIVAHLPVYRTYVTAAGIGEVDERYLDWALAQGRRDEPQLEGSVFRFVDRALRANLPAGASDEYVPQETLRFAMKAQQFSGAVAAKGIEDTAFYRYLRLVSLNEVGGDPTRFGISPAAFHQMNQQRLAAHPQAMLTTASHDHKRGEDTRLRISAISERADEWRTLVFRWTRLNRSKRHEIGGRPAPDRNDEYLIYQTLVGVWPGSAEIAASDDFVHRLVDYMHKAVREAKRRSSWIAPNEEYEAAMTAYVHGILDPGRSRAFLASFAPFADRIARIAAAGSLSHTLLKLASPGVPDLYQGADYWDLSLVDPDNRRPVDFAARQASLVSGDDWTALAMRWRTAEIKQRLIAQVLALRKQEPDLFSSGSYLPLTVAGERGEHVVAFARGAPDKVSNLIVVATRLNGALLADDDTILLDTGSWRDTYLELPAELQELRYANVFTNTAVRGAAQLRMENVLSRYPVALIVGRKLSIDEKGRCVSARGGRNAGALPFPRSGSGASRRRA
ncbi:MAG: malto-oligosyltrehalose synthase [Gammaproteobacteria bacterium]